MNVQTDIKRPPPVMLTSDDFLLLKRSGAFAGFSKSELLNGELWGVPLQDEEEPQSDASFPIRLGVEDYLLLDRAGAFKAVGGTELVNCLVYPVSPQHRPHGFAKDELAYRLRRALEALGSPLHVATKQSAAMAPYSEPQPDIILTTEPRGVGAIPAGSVALLAEISDSSVTLDLREKPRVYSGSNIPEYWLVDVNARVIHQMWRLSGQSHSDRRETPLGERISAAAIDGLAVETTGLA